MAINPETFVNALDSMWNTQDVDTALSAFTDDAVVRLMPPPPPPQPGVFRGKAEVRRFIETFIPGFQVRSTNFRAEGDRVTWNWQGVGDQFRRMGADVAGGTGEALAAGDKVKEFTVTFSQETLAKMAAAG